MQALAARAPTRTVAVFGVAATAAAAAVLCGMMDAATYDTWGALLVAPALVLVSIPVFVRTARRDMDGRLVAFLATVLVLKLGASLLRYMVMQDVYQGGDALAYDAAARTLAPRLRGLDLAGAGGTGTAFLELVTGAVYAVIGPSIIAGFFVFAWLSFWGLFLWWRAFRIAFPAADARRYALGVFLLPSTIFWPSSIGKEAWMTLALGLAAYGVARLLAGARGGIVALVAGLWAAAMVRPHFAVLIVASAALAAVMRAQGRFAEGRRARGGLVARAAVVAALVGLTLLFVGRTETFFAEAKVGDASLTGVLVETQRRSTQGGSEFEARVVRSPLELAPAVATVLFRPLPTEAHNLPALLAAAESSLLAVLLLVRGRAVVRALRRMRHAPYVAFATAYVLLFCAAFAAIGNFGIVARQRSLMLPALLAILVATPRAEKGA